MPPIDWSKVFAPTIAPLELVLRASLIYIAVFTLLRMILKREAGALNLADLLALVLIANASQRALTSEAASVPENLLVVMTILGWNYALDWGSQRFAFIRRYVHPPPLPLIENGRYLPRNMRHEMITRDEIESRLRLAGVEDVRDVKCAYMEGDGQISVITFDHEQPPSVHERRAQM